MENAYLYALKFLHILDPTNFSYAFQTFDDDKTKKDPNLVRQPSGDFKSYWPELQNMNSKGAYVGYCPQETNGKRGDAGVIAIRCLYMDDDNGADQSKFPLQPTVSVRTSPGKYHHYWMLKTPVPLDPLSHQIYRDLINAVIQLGGDPSAKGVSRVLRLPGTYNCKPTIETCLVTYEVNPDFLGNPKKYEWEELKSAFLKAETDFDFEAQVDAAMSSKVILEPFLTAYNASALEACDPSCDHDTWTAIGMALHHASGGSEQGYRLFHMWSAGGSNYISADWPTQWNYFKSDGKEKLRTIGSLYHIAKHRYGWDQRYSVDIPDVDLLVRQERLNCKEYLNNYYGLVTMKSKINLIYHETDSLNRWTYNLLSDKNAAILLAPKRIPRLKYLKKDIKIETECIYEPWKEWDGRNFYAGLTFDPRSDITMDTKNPTILPTGKKYNTFIGFENLGSGDVALAQPIIDHISEVWCKGNKARLDYVLNWLAAMFQYPGDPAQTMILLRSRPGAGKNIITEPLFIRMGKYGRLDNDGNAITAKFNSTVAQAIFVLIGEAYFDNNPLCRNALNSLITQPYISVEFKFEDRREIRNCAHIIACANEDVPINIQPGDRRIYVLACSNHKIGDFKYFKTLKNQIESGGMDAFIKYLRERDISDFVPMIMPTPEKGVKSSMITYDPKHTISFVLRALEDKNFNFLTGEPHPPTEIEVDTLYRAYRVYCDDAKSMGSSKKVATKTWLGRKLKELFPEELFWITRSTQGKRPRLYRWTSFEDLRVAFDNYLGAPSDWSFGDDDDDSDERKYTPQDIENMRILKQLIG